MPPLGFLEPLRELLGHHGERLQDHLSGIRSSMAAVASNTEAQLVRNQFARKSVATAATKTEQLRNDSAYGWLIKWAASTAKVQVFIGTDTDESFMLELLGHGAEKVDWYVPVGGVVFVKNTEAAEGKAGNTNFEVEVLVSDAAEGYTGPTDERIEVERREPVPSGTPLDTPEAP